MNDAESDPDPLESSPGEPPGAAPSGGEPAKSIPPEPIEVRAVPFDAGAAGEQGARTVDVPPSSPLPPPPTPPPAPGGAGGGAAPERNHAWAMACHLVTLVDFGVPMFLIGVIAPLVLWLWKKDEDPEVDHHGKESLNFQLNLLFWTLVSWALVCCLIGIPLLIALPLVKLVFVVLAAIQAARGERYEYPLIYRVVR